MSSRSFRYCFVPVGTCVIWPRHGNESLEKEADSRLTDEYLDGYIQDTEIDEEGLTYLELLEKFHVEFSEKCFFKWIDDE